MFNYFKGYVTDKKKSSKGAFITVEIADIGYSFEVPDNDYNCFQIDDNEKVKIFSHLIHREDAMLLYGFKTKESRDIFQILLSVSGVGAKMAIALLSEFDTYDLITLVIDGNFKELTRAKGVGPKLAQKIILELKDKLIKHDVPKVSVAVQQNQAISDAQTIMLSLGYEENEIDDALNKVISTVVDKDNPEEILRKALTCLSV